MENISLYDFPKDMLVKLVSTIREHTKKEIREEVEKETELLLLKVINKDYNYCYKCESCDSFLIVGNEDSIIYSAGVGEDISFDLLLSDKYKSHIYMIDPTERALKHYESIYEGYKGNDWDFSGQDIQKDYWGIINELRPNLKKMYYVKKGLWKGRDIMKFYKQENEK